MKKTEVVKKLIGEKGMVFPDEDTRTRYLSYCEELFALAEDFNRIGYDTEATILKDGFSSIVKQLGLVDEQELQESMESRGL